jgi:hypothetical protein
VPFMDVLAMVEQDKVEVFNENYDGKVDFVGANVGHVGLRGSISDASLIPLVIHTQ